MKITELFPSAEDRKRLQDIESTLLRRRTAGSVAGVLAILSAALQAVFAIAEKGYIDKLRSVELDRNAAIIWGILIGAALIYFLMRRTSVLLKESKDAFRYTFWIEPFAEVAKTPGDRFRLGSSDRFALLHHDLTERLDQRIKRFAILKEPPSGGQAESSESPEASPRRYSSHIHISGHYAVREKNEDKWFVHVMPEVRIGPPGAPAMLAHPVWYLLNDSERGSKGVSKAPTRPGGRDASPPAPEPEDKQCAHTLEASEYRDIVERVYSSVATEVYRQLDSDVRQKIALFPTSHLRAIALYHEAEDFARSNTVDAYERAIALYREALRFFDLTSVRAVTRLLLRVRWILWRVAVNYHHEWARVVAGYAKCLIYRRETSALTGRESNPLYELPELLGEATEALNRLQQRIGKRGADSRLERILAYLMYPRDSWLNRLVGLSYTPLFEAQKNALFELYLVDALAQHFLECRERALQRLVDAAATAPDRVGSDPLYLVAKGLLEPVDDKATVYFTQAVELAPHFQIARWFLAQALEKSFRQQEEITSARSKVVLDAYGEVATLNYGNILALSAQGYLRWLICDSEARQCLDQGRQVKAIANETFVGELSYRLARIAAESGSFEECCSLYLEATAADPEVGAVYPGKESRVRSADFEEIGVSMLRRFESYKTTVENLIKQEREKAMQGDSESRQGRKPVAGNTLRIGHAFVLNDYANACLRYFHYHGDRFWLERAIEAYKKATEVNPADARPWFNLQNAYSWTGESEKKQKCNVRARQLAPTWTSVAIEAAKERATESAQELGEEKRKFKNAKDRIEKIKWELREGPRARERAREFESQQTTAELESVSSERQMERLRVELKEARDEALKEIRENSRLVALFEGPIEDQVQRLVSIPRRKLDGRDVEMMIRLAEMLALGHEQTELEAAEILAKHLLELAPEEYSVTAVLLDLIPRLLPDARKDGQSAASNEGEKERRKLLERVKEQDGKIVNKWLETHRRNFLALYWYVDYWRRAGGITQNGTAGLPPEHIKERYFGDDPHEYEDLLGWVLSRRGEDEEAARAFSRAIELKPGMARYRFHFGQCRERLEDWESARAAYCEARRLDPDSSEYQSGLASVLNQIGNQHWREDRFADAADTYAQAVRLAPEVAVYHRNLALARERAKLPDAESALGSAIQEMQTALDLAPEGTEYQDERRRLETRLDAFKCYGSSRTMDFATVVSILTVEYGSDLEAFVRERPGMETGGDLERRDSALQNQIKLTYGVSVPKVRWRLNETDMFSDRYLAMVREVPVVDGAVRVDKKLCLRTTDELRTLGLSGYPVRNPLGNGEAVWLEPKDWAIAEASKLPLLDALDYVLTQIEDILVSRLHEFLGDQDVMRRLKGSPLREVRAIAYSPQQTNALTEMLQALLAERTPITDFDRLCRMFLRLSVRCRPWVVIECMRSLKGVREKLWGNSKDFTLLRLGPRFTKLIADNLKDGDMWQVLALEPHACQDALAAVRVALQDVLKPALVVEKRALRIYVRKLIELEFPRVPVLAKRELLKGLTVATNWTIELNDALVGNAELRTAVGNDVGVTDGI